MSTRRFRMYNRHRCHEFQIFPFPSRSYHHTYHMTLLESKVFKDETDLLPLQGCK
jgi:hypothetical protein